ESRARHRAARPWRRKRTCTILSEAVPCSDYRVKGGPCCPARPTASDPVEHQAASVAQLAHVLARPGAEGVCLDLDDDEAIQPEGAGTAAEMIVAQEIPGRPVD